MPKTNPATKLSPAEQLLDLIVRHYNKVDDSESGMLEHQKQRFIYRRLRPIAQRAFELLEQKVNQPCR